MATTEPQDLLFAAALVRRAVAAAGAGLVLLGNVAAASQSAALSPVQRAACPVQPAAAIAAGREDGQFAL